MSWAANENIKKKSNFRHVSKKLIVTKALRVLRNMKQFSFFTCYFLQYVITLCQLRSFYNCPMQTACAISSQGRPKLERIKESNQWWYTQLASWCFCKRFLLPPCLLLLPPTLIQRVSKIPSFYHYCKKKKKNECKLAHKHAKTWFLSILPNCNFKNDVLLKLDTRISTCHTKQPRLIIEMSYLII
jgi:hypothetical protein